MNLVIKFFNKFFKSNKTIETIEEKKDIIEEYQEKEIDNEIHVVDPIKQELDRELESKKNEFNDLLTELKQKPDKTIDDEALLSDMMELGEVMVSVENLSKELDILKSSPNPDKVAIKEAEVEFEYALMRLKYLTGVQQHEARSFIYHAPLDPETDEVQWVPYVFENRDTLINYAMGRKLAQLPLIKLAVTVITNIIHSYDFDPSYDSYATKIKDLIDNGALPLLFEQVDFSMSSTRLTGILPDGTLLEDVSHEESIEITQKFLKTHLSNNLDSVKDTKLLEYRLEQISNLLNVTCPYCGVPHEFKDVIDIPHYTQNCTLCNRVLIQYIGD